MAAKKPAQKRTAQGTFRTMIDEVLAQKMHDDYAENGVSYGGLSQKYGFSRSSIYEAFQRYGFKTRLIRDAKPNQKLLRSIATMYKSGKTLTQIRSELGLKTHNSTLAANLRANGVEIRSRAQNAALRWKTHRDKIPNIIKEYKEGVGVSILAKRYGVNESFCLRWLRRNGITIRHYNDPIYSSEGQSQRKDQRKESPKTAQRIVTT